ncbi:sigma-70 family RNA polymerase sigma factor [Paenibacillus lautus]|uniref:Sigma-70 family RNA polymerase sigma factor n=1 Tax=Paenibacillus lautus TaxID=1401 RepID=A0A385TU89_PAELA|nr:sigma-70 family RNA polymerase sigma factor [Paenibacillus lautus]AYB47153.1 sigma-70 family RNA polymerase sigma factor [Paenibacillus lautus]
MPELYNPHLGNLEEFVLKHSDFVTAMAHKNLYKSRGAVDVEDLIQAGMVGLIKAYRKYQPRDNAKFEGYAYYQIKKEILVFIRDHSEAIRPSRDVYEIAGSIMKQELKEQKPEQIAAKLGCTVPQARRALIHLDKKSVASLNETLTAADGSSIERIELLETYQDFTQVFVNDFVEKLNHTETAILNFLSLDMTQKEIGQKFGISQTHAGRMVKKLRSQAIEYFWSDVAWTG